MGIESSRSGVVNADTRRHTHLASCLLSFFGHTLQCLLFFVHTDGTIIGLAAGGQSRTGCRRVCHRIGDGERGSHRGNGEGGEEQGLSSDTSLHLSAIHLGGVHLVDTHAVADEVEHILGLLGIDHACQQQ